MLWDATESSTSDSMPGSENGNRAKPVSRRAHYFVGGWDWYVAELDAETDDALGFADLGYRPWGYFNPVEMEQTVALCVAGRREGPGLPGQDGLPTTCPV
jgi:hypothetical protein